MCVSLLDGCLILQVDEIHSAEPERRFAVHWQGDSRRRSEVSGAQRASAAVWRHMEWHDAGRIPTNALHCASNSPSVRSRQPVCRCNTLAGSVIDPLPDSALALI